MIEAEFLMEGVHPRVQQQMRPAFGPLLHLRLLQGVYTEYV